MEQSIRHIIDTAYAHAGICHVILNYFCRPKFKHQLKYPFFFLFKKLSAINLST
ncbi:hypothetical protein RG47T_3371 [Mucilaginibacter polytrichastri]|uniref:Uncharacterized protein n=1 Tax=Mucilaginibacter polytrichastri TaxID=1302689 RepID=A0A1Q6A1N3_9SPHI|nr:hypothetical protein RG47T_3371 [Mucilaginibacter polytrichastri]